ncbi:MAG: tetratricopeptide repeat protein [Planctomycetota bacterium]
MMRALLLVVVVVSLIAVISCRREQAPADKNPSTKETAQGSGGLTIDYPLDETIFPPEIIAPTFRWTDTNSKTDAWLIDIEFADDDDAMSFQVERPAWTPGVAEWERIKQLSLEQPARISIHGINQARPDVIISRADITISTSRDEAGAPIFYREVNLPFSEAVKDPTQIRWRFGAISSPEQPPIVLENLPVCGNCHSFSADASVLGMDVDYANDKGSYALTAVEEEITLSPDKIITWSDYRREDHEHTFGLLSQVSPDGRYAISTVKDRSVFVPVANLMISQLFFPIKGILAVYDRETEQIQPLPGADDPRLVQSNPTWSPDGKHIVFARAEVYQLKTIRDRGSVLLAPEECEAFLKGGQTFQFDLYRIPFNNGKGGQPEPLEGASNNGMSNYFARYSPDGKWIVFCRAKSFMLLQPDSELYIIPAKGGEARRMRCNTTRMNSWHSWSPNSRWLVFSSKANTPYTQLFLTHIDEQGRSSPAVLLSQFTSEDRAANIPEFVAAGADAIKSIREQFLDDVSYVRSGDAFRRAGDLPGAEREYRQAIELNPDNAIAHSSLGSVLLAEGQDEEGARELLEALRCDPSQSRVHYNLGMLRVRQRRIDEAINHLATAVRIEPELADAHSTLGSLFCAQGNFPEGATHFTEALRHDPNNAAAHYGLGELLLRQGSADQAFTHLSLAVRIDPAHASAHYSLGKMLFDRGRPDEAIRHLSAAAQHAPDDTNMLRDLAWALVTVPDPRLRDDQQAVQLAKRACELTNYQQIESLDVLGVCYAQVGQFEQAIEMAEKALQLARDTGNEMIVNMIQQRIELYKHGQTYQPMAAPRP